MPSPTINTAIRDLDPEQVEFLDEIYEDFPEFGYTRRFNEEGGPPRRGPDSGEVVDALLAVFTTDEEKHKLAHLAHAKFSDGLEFGVSKTCRTPYVHIQTILQAPELLGEDLFRLLEAPGRGTRKNDFNKYHFVGLLRLLGYINGRQATELDGEHLDNGGDFLDQSLLSNALMDDYPDFFCSEGARKRTKSIKVVPPTKKPELFKQDWKACLLLADLDELKVMSAALLERQKELSEQALALVCLADPVPEEEEEEFECPEGFEEVEEEKFGKFWENEDTGQIVYPCEDWTKAESFCWNDDTTEIIPYVP